MKECFDFRKPAQTEAEEKETLDFIDGLCDMLKAAPEAETVLINPRRYAQFRAAVLAARRYAEKEEAELSYEFDPMQCRASIELRGLCFYCGKEAYFPAELAFADNLDIYADLEGCVRIGFMFYDMAEILE